MQSAATSTAQSFGGAVVVVVDDDGGGGGGGDAGEGHGTMCRKSSSVQPTVIGLCVCWPKLRGLGWVGVGATPCCSLASLGPETPCFTGPLVSVNVTSFRDACAVTLRPECLTVFTTTIFFFSQIFSFILQSRTCCPNNEQLGFVINKRGTLCGSPYI